MTTQEKEIIAVLRIEGGTADDGILDVYDAANTIYGLARVTNLINHAFANDQEVRSKGSTAKGSQTFIHSSKKGCFEEQIDIVFESKIVQKIGHSVMANIYWDYFALCCSYAIGKEYTPSTAHNKKILTVDPDFAHEIADALETPLRDVQKAISKDSNVKVYFSRPRVGDIIELDEETLSYVTTREIESTTSYIRGNATKFNVLTGFGRLYSDEEKRTISFSLKNLDDKRVKNMILGSMKDRVDGEKGKLNFKVSQIVSANGITKKYIVHDTLKIITK